MVDVKNGFWHVPLDDEGSNLTTLGPFSMISDALWHSTGSRRISELAL